MGYKRTVICQRCTMTMGFPVLDISMGSGAKIKIQYQEALFDQNNTKSNRNEWKHKTMKGYYDVFLSDGGTNRLFEPLWIRTFRYVKIEIETKNESLIVNDFYNQFSAYPFEQKATFTCDEKSVDRIWDVSWQTVRLCALESYMDCPYYEQLQYIGDTRIQALISMNVAGDNKLAKNAIEHFNNSLQPFGLTKSSHPTAGVQIIPPFSLLYISMVHDYFMLQDDTQFINKNIPAIRFILDWFIARVDNNGMLGPLPYWNHVDGGAKEYIAGSPPGIEKGGSAHMSLLMAYSMNDAAEIFDYFGYECDATNYRLLSKKIVNATLTQCYDAKKGLIAETSEKKLYTQILWVRNP